MRVLVTMGPNAGSVLDMCTRQAEDAVLRGWAQLPDSPDQPATPLPDGTEENVSLGAVKDPAEVEPTRSDRGSR